MFTVREIVESGLCIGCGLCEAIAPEDVAMRMTSTGVERPAERIPVTGEQLAEINRVCPGLQVQADVDDPVVDSTLLWGQVRRLAKGYASDPAVRFESATGGVLTALAQFLLTSGRVEQILHVGPVPGDPLHWQAKISTTVAEVADGARSRYGPAAPLTRLVEVLESGIPTAVVAKPCDIAGVRSMINGLPIDHQAQVRYVLAMACGGASRMSKTHGMLNTFGLTPDQVVSLSYRGFGNPGPTAVVDTSGSTHSLTYQELWEDESAWDLQWRCKVCADGMGEVADIVSLDCWPGGGPTGEDDGFNGIIVRTDAGTELFEAAVDVGALVLSDDNLPVHETLETWQPHQSRRKKAVPQRLAAMATAGLPSTTYRGVHLDEFTTGEVDAGTAVRISNRANGDPQPSFE